MKVMRTHYVAVITACAAAFIGSIGLTVVTAQDKTVWSGIYTAEQSARGKAKATAECSACHGANLEGDAAPTLKGNDFIGHWYDAKLGEFAAKVTQTMPATAPGSLKPEEYADVIAYLLELNGFPAGTETLKVEPAAALDAVKITKSK